MAREPRKPPSRFGWMMMAGMAALAVVGVSTAMAAFKVRQYLVLDPQFRLSRDHKDALSIQGLRYASHWTVQHVFAGDYDRSVYLLPLAERQQRLEAIDWIESASVSRVWPDRVLVRLRERQPVAFVNLNRGVMLIDAYGKLLDPPPQAQFTFPVLSGIADGTNEADCAAHVATFLRVEADMGYLMKDISEVDTTEAEDVHLVAKAGDRAVVLLVGEGNYAARYANFVNHFPEIVKRSPRARTFDLRLDDRITVRE